VDREQDHLSLVTRVLLRVVHFFLIEMGSSFLKASRSISIKAAWNFFGVKKLFSSVGRDD
jgi:hypothetical protein